MDLRLFYALILTILPFTELRVGLPLAISFAMKNDVSLILIFFLIIFVNIILIFFIFWFLDNIHHVFMGSKFYRRNFEKLLVKLQKKTDKFERKYETLGFMALVLFVAIPLPGTGAWSGSIISWILGLNRKKSIISIAAGVLIAGILIFLGTLGFINLFS